MNKPNLDFKEIHEWPSLYRYVLFAFLFVVLLGVGYWFDTAPLSERYERSVSEQKLLMQRLEIKKRQQPNIQKAKEDLKSLQVKLSRLLKALPNSKEIPALVDHIAKAAQKAKLSVEMIKPLKVKQLKMYQRLPIEMSLTGEYPEIQSFLKQLSQMERIVEVSNFHLAPVDSKQPERLKMDLELNTFIYRPMKK